ncbi:MAG TPA: protein kinase [Planctomycetota bacterium]|nr:protein kinase [Planctomycetota bacterium]
MDPSEDRTAPLDHSLGSARFTQPYVGARFGRFEILSELGRGGYGAVFRARDTLSGQEVALKLLLSSVVDERDIERFRREALVATRVRHPGIVPVLDAGTAEGKPFVSMGLVAGQPLHKLELTLEDHVRVLVRVARAVGAAHKVGVIHRDLKPPNVIVNPKTQAPVVLDFGLAFDERLTRLSRTGEIMGSPVWMAPETVRGDARPDARLDVYALGLMLYSRLAGKNPFSGHDAIETFRRISKGVPPLPAGVDKGLAEIALRATSLDVARRPVDGDAFARELEAWLSGTRKPARSSTARLALLLAGAGLLAALVAGTVAALAWQRPRPAAPPPPPPRPVVPDPPRPRAHLMADKLAASIASDVALAFNGGGPRTEQDARMQHEAVERLKKVVVGLASAYPEDGRALLLDATQRTFDDGAEHDTRRQMMRALRLEPPPEAWEIDIAGRFSHMLGFERASADVGELLASRPELAPPERIVYLVQLYLRASPPVVNPERAEELGKRLLARKTPANEQIYPDSWLLYLHLADARVGLRDAAGATRYLERAGSLAPDASTEAMIEKEAAALRRALPGPETMGRRIRLAFPTTPFLGQVAEIDVHDDPTEEKEAATAYERLAKIEAEQSRPERAALAWIRAARSHERLGRTERRFDALEAAAALSVPADTRALVCRELARARLEVGAADAACPLALEATKAPEREPDVRTPGEIADAWVLVARAREAQGQKKEAREALAHAIELRPVDHREIDELRRRLGD